MINPEQVIVTKEQVIHILDKIISRCKKNYKKNIQIISTLQGMKFGMSRVSDKEFKTTWSILVDFTNEMIIFNEVQKMKGEFPKSQEFIDIFCQKILDGYNINFD